MALERDFALYENTNGSGFASIGQDLHDPTYPQYRVNDSRALAANDGWGRERLTPASRTLDERRASRRRGRREDGEARARRRRMGVREVDW